MTSFFVHNAFILCHSLYIMHLFYATFIHWIKRIMTCKDPWFSTNSIFIGLPCYFVVGLLYTLFTNDTCTSTVSNKFASKWLFFHYNVLVLLFVLLWCLLYMYNNHHQKTRHGMGAKNGFKIWIQYPQSYRYFHFSNMLHGIW